MTGIRLSFLVHHGRQNEAVVAAFGKKCMQMGQRLFSLPTSCPVNIVSSEQGNAMFPLFCLSPPFLLSHFATVSSYPFERSTATIVLNHGQFCDSTTSLPCQTEPEIRPIYPTSTSSSSRTPPRLPPGSIISNSSHALETPSSPILRSAVRTLSSASSSSSPVAPS